MSMRFGNKHFFNQCERPSVTRRRPAANILIQSTENLSCAAAADSESEAARTENRAGFWVCDPGSLSPAAHAFI